MSERVLPEGWAETTAGDIAEIIAGGTPKAGNPDNFTISGEGIPWLTPSDLAKYDQKTISRGARDLSEEGYASCSAKLMPAGSLVFSSRAPIGYVAISNNELCTNQGFKSFVFSEGVNSSFAYYYLRSIRKMAESMGTGTTFKEVSGAKIKTLPVVLPPKEEQKVIADKLDEMLAQVSNMKTRLDAIPAILKRFRQSVLADAVSGSLDSEACEKGSSKSQTIKFEDILKNKNHLSYGVLKPGEFDETGVPMIRVMDVGEWGRFNNTEVFKISRGLSLDFKRTVVDEGDIVLSVMATIGRSAIVPASLAGANVNRALAVIKLSEKVVPKYVLLQLLSPFFQESFVDKQIGSAQKRINLSDLRKFDIWVPDIHVQNEIVRHVDKLFAFADQIEEQVQNAQARINKLTQSILAKAFRGELTTEWRAENPELISGENSAEALLERIKAEKAKLRPAEKRRGRKPKQASMPV